jgi:hypothetical protein
VSESESEQKYENKYNMSDIRSYPIHFHPYPLVEVEGATSISTILLVDMKMESFPPYKYVRTLWAKHTKTTMEEPLV